MLYRSFDIFVGLDVHKSSISASFLDHNKLIKSIRFPYSPDNIISFVQNHFPHKKVVFAYEAGPLGYSLYDTLSSAGFLCLIVAPAMIPSAPGKRVKTDRLDSLKLAESLRAGQLKSIHIPSIPYRHLRHLIKSRDLFAKQVISAKIRIRSILLFENIPFPSLPQKSAYWSTLLIQELRSLELPDPLRFRLDQAIDFLLFAQQQLKSAQKSISTFSRHNPEIHRNTLFLTSIPGIGATITAHLLARVGDPSLLHNPRQLSAFLGLVPTERSSGQSIVKGHISRVCGDRLINKLIQGAWTAIRLDPELRNFYTRIYQRNPRQFASQKAIVAVARKLTTRIYRVLKDQRPYVIHKEIIHSPSETRWLREREAVACSTGS